MASDLEIDTQRLRDGAARLDGAIDCFRRTDPDPPIAAFPSTAFGTGGAAVEAADSIVRRLRHGAECAALLSDRCGRLADSLRTVAAEFDRLEADLGGAPR